MPANMELSIQIWPLNRIVPYPRNARKITPAAIEKVALSLREFGWRQPIVVDPDGVVIAGHVRLAAATSNGWTEAPVHVADNLSPEQIRQYRLMDNRSHDEATWDMDVLSLEMADLGQLSLSLDLTGFTPEQIAAAAPKPDLGDPDAPVTPAVVPISRLGDVWLCGPHRVLCGDSTNPAQVAALLGGAAGDAVYDPFLGSGTTLIAAASTDRICYGIDIDPIYVDVAVRRWQQLTGLKATTQNGATFDDIASDRLPAAEQATEAAL